MNLHTYSPLFFERKADWKHFVIGSENLLTELSNSSYSFPFVDFQVDLCTNIPFYIQDTVSIFQHLFLSQCPGRPVLLLFLHSLAAPPLLALEKRLLQKGWYLVFGLTPASLRNFLRGLDTLWTNHCLFSHIYCRVFTAGICGRPCPICQLFKKW